MEMILTLIASEDWFFVHQHFGNTIEDTVGKREVSGTHKLTETVPQVIFAIRPYKT